MKTKALLLIVLLSGITLQAWSADKHEPKLKHVTIFTNGAQVERNMSLDLTAGEHVLTFTGLSPYTDTKSMQVKARGKLTILGINHRKAHPDSLEQVKKLKSAQQQLKTVTTKESELTAQREVLESQMEMVKGNCSVGSRTVATPLAGIKELNNYYSQEMLTLKKRLISLDEEMNTLKEEKSRRQATVDSIARLPLSTVTEVDVKVSVPKATHVDFDLTYYVKNAGWYPTYDLRSESTHSPVRLSYKANVFQNTKENWRDVSVTLSSANPNLSNIAPTLRTYWLDYGRQAPRYDQADTDGEVSGYVTDEAGEPLIGASVTVVGTHLGAVTDVNGFYSITMPKDSKQLKFAYIGYQVVTRRVNGPTLNVQLKEDKARLEEVVVVGYGTKKGKSSRKASAAMEAPMMDAMNAKTVEAAPQESELISVSEQKAQFGYEFEIQRPLTLLSDGKVTTTEIGRHDLAAHYEYRGIPRADKEAFLVADATGWQTFNLLEGEANVYFDNSFVGKTIIDPNIANDTLHFSLGRDNSIRILRTKVAEQSTRKLLASNQEQNMTWRITVKNTRNEAVALRLEDQVPVSTNSNITVNVEELSGGSLNRDTGIVSWNLNLQPGEQRDLILQYRVKYPKNKRLTIE